MSFLLPLLLPTLLPLKLLMLLTSYRMATLRLTLNGCGLRPKLDGAQGGPGGFRGAPGGVGAGWLREGSGRTFPSWDGALFGPRALTGVLGLCFGL